jgi:hypothetical protein
LPAAVVEAAVRAGCGAVDELDTDDVAAVFRPA